MNIFGSAQFERICNILGVHPQDLEVEKSIEIRSDNLGDIFRLRCVESISKVDGRRAEVRLRSGEKAYIGDKLVKHKNGEWNVVGRN